VQYIQQGWGESIVGNAGPWRLLEIGRAKIRELKWPSAKARQSTMGHIRGHGCRECGMIGADVRPDLGPHVNKQHILGARS
jgi:hypothetical protein